jgi:lysine biosynthesis protein LysW
MTWTCGECGAAFEVPDDVEEGELVACSSCAMEYEVLAADPLALALFEEDEK